MIDLTGLSPESVHVVEALVARMRAAGEASPPRPASIFDLFGKAARPRSGADIARQLDEERDAWGEP